MATNLQTSAAPVSSRPPRHPAYSPGDAHDQGMTSAAEWSGTGPAPPVSRVRVGHFELNRFYGGVKIVASVMEALGQQGR